MKILYNHDIDKIPFNIAIDAIRDFFESAKAGRVTTPPRHKVQTEKGGLVFTIGAEMEKSQTIGFRVYDTYPSKKGTDTDQIVAVYSTEESQLKGLVIGGLLGAIRTAAINGYAASILADKEVEQVCVIGAGHQAYYQIKAVLAVRSPKEIYIYNRTLAKAELLANRLREEYDMKVTPIVDLKASVKNSDMVLCCTSSPEPVIEVGWLKDNAYVSSIGPKFLECHELPKDIGLGEATLVSDAVEQLSAYSKPYFLEDIEEIIPLEDLELPFKRKGHRIFLSTGRSGTEVIVADRFIEFLND